VEVLIHDDLFVKYAGPGAGGEGYDIPSKLSVGANKLIRTREIVGLYTEALLVSAPTLPLSYR
jgi:hypothetical protein